MNKQARNIILYMKICWEMQRVYNLTDEETHSMIKSVEFNDLCNDFTGFFESLK